MRNLLILCSLLLLGCQRFTGTDKINISFKMGQLVPEEIAQQDKYGEALQK